jgi:hypothetical protein
MRNAFVMALLLVAAGCGRQEEVRRYKAPKDPSWRILGAVSASGGATWFFKLAAPADRIDGVRDGVVAFYKSFRTEDGRLKWTVPAGWTEEKGNANREATLRFGDHEPKLEISVTRLQGDGGGMLANLNRWREQIGLEKVGEADLAAQVQKIDGAAIEVFLIDLTGPTRPSGGPKGMARQAEAPPPSANHAPGLEDIRALFTFERPPNWKENSQPSSGRIFEFMVDDAGGSALVSLSALQGGGDLASNVNRWRGQAGLEPLPEADIPKVAAPMSFVGNEAWLVEAIGKERGIVVVASLSPQFSIFLKMDGAPATVQSQKATFMRVAQTFQMKGRHE